MNKILSLLIVLIVVYQSLGPLVKVFTKKTTSRKKYKVNFSKQFNHLFSATLLLVIPLLFISSYYHIYAQFPFILKIGLGGLIALCWIGACISFYLYRHYRKKTSYESLIYDPQQLTIELLTGNSKQTVRLNQVRRMIQVSTKNYLKLMPWSNFEYLVLELSNGSRVIIPSLMIAPGQLHSALSGYEVMLHKKIIPTIR